MPPVTRFAAIAATDARLQFRYGLYGVSLAMVVIWGSLLVALARRFALDPGMIVMPLVALNLLITTFYFIAALVLFEKGDEILTALAITPLRPAEYLLSKAVTLSLLATVETLLIVAIVFGSAVSWPPLVAGTVLLALLFSFAGFVSVVRFRTINEFLFPSSGVTILLVLPALAHFGMLPATLMIFHPAAPAFALIAAGGGTGGSMYGWLLVAGGIVWIMVFLLWSLRSWERFVVRSG
jgi:fluoroquinolone transport system permease protein